MQVDTNGEQKTMLGSLFAAFDPRYQKAVQDGMAGDAIGRFAGNLFGGTIKAGFGNAPYANHLTQRDNNKIYGPVDMIHDTHIRSDEGLKFNHNFTLTFEYELRAYNNINTRQAMLDLLANILAVTYQAGDFFPGGQRSIGAPQSDIFTNLQIMKTSGGVTSFVDGIHKDTENLLSKVKSYVEGNGGFVETAKQIGNSFGGMILGGLLNSFGRPQKHVMNSLLSPAPVGLWHVMVGNPFHPIMSIGNMILEKTTITHTGPLGLDDFPTGLKVVCELKRAKGRDKRDIEKLYMHGINRIYSHMGTNIEDLYKSAPEYKADNKSLSSLTNDYEGFRGTTDSIVTNADYIAAVKDVKIRHFGTHYMDALKLSSGEISYGSQTKNKPETLGVQNAAPPTIL
jgi:hypothetical protein